MYNERLKAATYFNADLAAWRPAFDLSRQATAIEKTHDSNIRLTWQAAAKHKISFYYDHNTLCQCPYLIGATYVGINAPEGATMAPRTTDLPQINWTAPLTNRLLVEVAGSVPRYTKGHDVYVTPVAPRITEQSTGVSFRGPNPSLFFDDENKTPIIKGSLSYVTGSHALKTGATYRHATAEQFYEIFQNLTYTTLNYRPVSVSYQATPYYPRANETVFGLFAQDQWSLNRVTINAGLRYDYYRQGYPDIHLPATQYVALTRDFPAADLVGWKDLSPRLGVAYNVFGNGKTAVKASISRYNVQALFLTDQNPARANVTMTRQWTDPNGDFIVQGDPFNPELNGELGPSQNRNFGKAIIPNNFDPDYAFGYGVRPFNWEGSASIQHELMSRISVNAAFFRRWYGNFQVTDNILVGPEDFTGYSVTVPNDPRLSNAGATLGGLFDLNPNKVGQNQTITTTSDNYGKQTEQWNGMDLSAQARLPRGVILQGGVSTGKTTTDNCEILADAAGECRRHEHGLLPHGDTVADAAQVRRVVHLPLRDSAVRHAAEFSGADHHRQCHLHQRAGAAVAGPAAVTGDHGDGRPGPAQHRVRRPPQSGRSADFEDDQRRPDANQGDGRHLQCRQHQHGHQREYHLRHDRQRMAGADGDLAGPADQGRRPTRLLVPGMA